MASKDERLESLKNEHGSVGAVTLGGARFYFRKPTLEEYKRFEKRFESGEKTVSLRELVGKCSVGDDPTEAFKRSPASVTNIGIALREMAGRKAVVTDDGEKALVTLDGKEYSFRSPTIAEYQQFVESDESNLESLHTLTTSCSFGPDPEPAIEMYPAALSPIGDALLKMAGSEVEVKISKG